MTSRLKYQHTSDGDDKVLFLDDLNLVEHSFVAHFDDV